MPEDPLTILGQCKASIMVQETGKSKETFFIVTRNAQVPPVSNKRPFKKSLYYLADLYGKSYTYIISSAREPLFDAILDLSYLL